MHFLLAALVAIAVVVVVVSYKTETLACGIQNRKIFSRWNLEYSIRRFHWQGARNP